MSPYSEVHIGGGERRCKRDDRAIGVLIFVEVVHLRFGVEKFNPFRSPHFPFHFFSSRPDSGAQR
jgi:hypothetical protein